MRTLSTAQTLVYTLPYRAVAVRVSVKDSGGTYRNLSTLFDRDWQISVEFGGTIDNPVLDATVNILREFYDDSFAPLVQTSRANVITGSYSALLGLHRDIKIETAVIAEDTAPIGSDWVLVFTGTIDGISWGQNPIQITARDSGGVLQDTYIEKELAYGLGITQSVGIWQYSTAYTTADYIVPGTLNGYYYKCTVAGSTAVDEPSSENSPANAWPTVINDTITDGSVTWKCIGTTSDTGTAVETIMQEILDSTLGAGVRTLYYDTAPLWDVHAFIQEKMPVLEALRRLAQQIGWDVRYVHNATPKLYLYEPDRAKVTPDYTFDGSDYYEIRSLSKNIAGIRNAIKVVYSNSATLSSDGQTPLRAEASAIDATSITAYGRRFMEICEASTSQIDTSTEAQAMADGCLADLKEPTAEKEAELPYFHAVQIGDLYRFTANNIHSTTDLDLAVVGFRHSLSAEGNRTTLTLRGSPAGAFKAWHDLGSRPGISTPPKLRPPNNLSTPSAGAIPGGVRVQWTGPRSDRWLETQIHYSTSTGFTPSAGNLLAKGKGSLWDFSGLTTGTTYYFKTITVDDKGKRSAPSPQISSRAGMHAFSAYRGSTQVVSSTGWQKVNIDTESFDYGAGFDAATNYRFTAPSAGVYSLEGQVSIKTLTDSEGTKTISCALYKNGSIWKRGTLQKGASTDIALRVSASRVSLAKDDYIELYFYAELGSTVDNIVGGEGETWLNGQYLII